jgi:DNA-binding IclR family transcriptional regulator
MPTPRPQFLHVNDVVPTIYDLLGITPPRVVNGISQDPMDGASFASTYERGRALPLFRGAASRIILAHLPARSIQRLYESNRRAFAEGRLGKSLDAVKVTLKQMRQRGWDITESQVTRGVTGIAAPVFDDRGGVLGSLSLTVGRTKLAEAEIHAIAERVTFCARIVTKALLRSDFVNNPII